MATVTWPAELPQKPLRNGYSEGTPDTTIRSNMDSGVDKVRRRFTAAEIPHTLTYQLTSAQVDILKSFYIDALTGGSLRFNMDHPRTGVTYEWRFTSVPEFKQVGFDRYETQIKLEQMP